MKKKLKQVADNIHGTIYLSDLESELISTPYFYRLNDIYQSSTVYMTFPSNRTKRYEHSLGTMALASRMLYSSVTNADIKTKTVLFTKLKEYFFDIVSKSINDDLSEKLYFCENKEQIDLIFDQLQITKENAISKIKDSVVAGVFNDTSLDFYQYYPTECIKDMKTDAENFFLYRCLLQAIRIVALFHDVGHPPYSHIIENVLKDIYATISNNPDYGWDKKKIDEFKTCLDRFILKDQRVAYKCDRLISKSSLINADLHERIGLYLLNSTIDSIIPLRIDAIANSEICLNEKVALILYNIVVVEFVFAILTEKNTFFKSFHKVVDGVLDSDRLDYIVRDSQNSGVDWGTIPYERIINSAKLFYLEKDNRGDDLDEQKKAFVIAYPDKISDDIEDLILVRYKIFARINFHHRCMKTSVALQAAIRYLAFNYLSNSDDEKCINPDISILWTALSSRRGNKKIRIIQWNDSWLISALHNALVSLHVSTGTLSTENKLLKESLEEILLNKKKYYTLLKRGRDNSRFVENVLEKAGITKQFVDDLRAEEYKKYFINRDNCVNIDNILSDLKTEAIDAISRINLICDNLDLECLCGFIPLDGSGLEAVINKTLKKNTELTNSAVIINYGRTKTGLPKHKDVLDAIYVYSDNECKMFDENYSLSKQINSLEKTVPWLYVYFSPKSNCNINSISQKLLDELSTEVAIRLRKRFEELFPNHF